jgi:hypothetical protein
MRCSPPRCLAYSCFLCLHCVSCIIQPCCPEPPRHGYDVNCISCMRLSACCSLQKTQSAWFCLQPYGDGPSRHVTMDCMAADTVPVFFDRCASSARILTIVGVWYVAMMLSHLGLQRLAGNIWEAGTPCIAQSKSICNSPRADTWRSTRHSPTSWTIRGSRRWWTQPSLSPQMSLTS